MAEPRFPDGAVAPARHAFAVTPHNTTELPVATKGIYVGGAGNVAIVPRDSTDPVVFTAVPVGTVLPVDAKLVRATDTTATLLVALA